MKLSLIVPMYNVREYIRQCLDSLTAQTLADMEVLMVNDGCTDNTPAIAAEYAERFPGRFILLNKPNGGLSDARNYAIPHAKGEYIAFLDSDDFVEPPLYEKMCALMDQGYDVCVTDIEYWYQDPARRFVMKGLSDWPAETIQKKALLSPMFAWNKVYKASFFRDMGLRYPLNTWYEDIPVTTLIFARSEKIGYLDECLMHYRQREGSIMANQSSPRLREIFGIMAMVRDRFEENGLTAAYRDELEYLHVEHLCLYGMFRFIRSDNRREYYDMVQAVMRQYWPQWKHNRYIANLGFKNRIFLKWYSRATAWLFHRFIR